MPTINFSFNDLLPFNILDHKDIIDDLSSKASGEALIEFQLDNVKKKWAELSFIVLPYNDQVKRYKITGIDEIITTLEDHSSSIQVIIF